MRRHERPTCGWILDASAKQLQEGKGAIVPGKSGESELVRRILSTDADE